MPPRRRPSSKWRSLLRACLQRPGKQRKERCEIFHLHQETNSMKPILSLAALVAAAAFPIYAWQAAPQQPKPKSQKEVDALKKVQADAQAGNPDQEIADINYVLENFADTEYKDMLLSMAMEAAERKNDYGQIVAFGQQVIQA